MLSESEQDYLKTIYKLQHEHDANQSVNTNHLAETLNVAAASVTNMLKNLAQMKLVNYEPYRGVRLTREGMKIALEVIRHHRLIELYLSKALGVPWDQVDQEAEKWEHVLSEDIADRIDAYLGNPTHDPHGSPIPTKCGIMPRHNAIPLSELEAGQSGVIVEVSDHEPSLLRYLSELGLTPNKRLRVIAREPFNGPISVKVGRSRRVIGFEVAQYIHVGSVESPSKKQV